MPRYFFHVVDGQAAIDATGIVMDNEHEARIEAFRGAAEMLTDNDMNVWLGNEWMMAVVDENGSVLFKLKISVEHPKRHTALVS